MASGSNVVRRVFFPGIAPYLQSKALQLPLSDKVKAALGPFTVHFWAPTFKWGICIANLVDIKKQKIENTSIPQQTAVAVTGLIWSRYSMVITPKNWNLFSVNLAMAITGLIQLCRITLYKYEQNQKK